VDRNYEPVCWDPDTFRANGGEVARVSPIDESQIRVILLDIEGTTTPVEFVYQTLSPMRAASWNRFFENTLKIQKFIH